MFHTPTLTHRDAELYIKQLDLIPNTVPWQRDFVFILQRWFEWTRSLSWHPVSWGRRQETVETVSDDRHKEADKYTMWKKGFKGVTHCVFLPRVCPGTANCHLADGLDMWTTMWESGLMTSSEMPFYNYLGSFSRWINSWEMNWESEPPDCKLSFQLIFYIVNTNFPFAFGRNWNPWCGKFVVLVMSWREQQ